MTFFATLFIGFNGVDENRFSLLSLLGENVGEFKDEDRGKYEVRNLKLRVN